MRRLIALSLLFVMVPLHSDEVVRHSPPESEVDCMVKNAFYEANGEGSIGRQLVMLVTHNRSPTNWCSAVYAYKQFSWTLSPRKKIPETSYKKIRDEVLAFYAGYHEAPAQLRKATYFHTHNVSPSWAPKLKKLGVYKNHVFYTRK